MPALFPLRLTATPPPALAAGLACLFAVGTGVAQQAEPASANAREVLEVQRAAGLRPTGIAPKVAQDRIVVPGDTLNVTVEEQPDLNKTYGVAGDGTISLDTFGRVNVAERSLEGARLAIVEHLEARYFKKATVTVSISNYVQGSVYVTGALARGSALELPFKGDELLTVFEAVTKGGGLAPRADGRNVKILRWKPGTGMQREIVVVDVAYMYETFDFSRDEYLRPRDILFVPELGGDDSREVLYLGEAGSPGYKPWSPNLNVLRLVAAYGYSSSAQLDSARILRPNRSGGYNTLPVDIALLLSGDMSQNLPIQAGDIVYIPRAGQSRAGVAYFFGQVSRQGPFELPLRGEMMLSQALLNLGASPFAKTDRITVIRKDPTTGKKSRLEFNAQKIWDTGNIEDDLPLQDGDVIMVGEKIFSL
jgi:protein involved in polysaccharide export with SLBB domain